MSDGILLKILFVSEDAEDETAIHETLEASGFNLILLRVDTEAEFTFELDNHTWDVVLIGDPLIKFPALRVLELMEKRLQKIPFLMVFGSLSDLSAIAILEVTKNHQFVTKSTMSTLGRAIARELEQAGERLDNMLKLKKSVVDMMQAWGKSLELRDKGTQGHTERVTELAVQLARKIGVSKKDLINIHRGALLHDIGKIGIPDSILLKAGALTEEEWVVMRMHPALAYGMLMNVEALKDALDIPYCHHEKWDGTGYPRGLMRNDIPLAARIFSVADVYDALTTPRPYRGAWTKGLTLRHMETLSGVAFDPEIVSVFVKMMESDE